MQKNNQKEKSKPTPNRAFIKNKKKSYWPFSKNKWPYEVHPKQPLQLNFQPALLGKVKKGWWKI